MPQFVNFTVVNATQNQELFTVTDLLSNTDILGPDAPLAPTDPPVALQANPQNNGKGLIRFGFKGGVATTNFEVADGQQVPIS